MLHPLSAEGVTLPERFTYPFCYEPHPLAILAADEVQHELERMDLLNTSLKAEGKMFGVLVVKNGEGALAFLAAYSGLLGGRNDWPYFVPPVFDAQQPDGHFKKTEREISAINEQINSENSSLLTFHSSLLTRRRQMSEDLQLWPFHQYRFLNARGEERDLVSVWQDYHSSPRIRRKFPLPPGGTGDCCAPKLLQEAYRQGLQPVTMAEFWWGPSPRSEIRHHRQFYPACRGKCKPVLTWMLRGLNVDPDPESLGFPHIDVTAVYEDDTLLVVNKPSGLLSVPGRIEKYSVATLLEERSPGVILVHRLDMGTSGLLVAAKTREAHYDLQQQFIRHEVKKQYVALLDGVPRLGDTGSSSAATVPGGSTVGATGEIRLPLYADPMNRPRQVVDYQHGKSAVTQFEILAVSNNQTRVLLSPHTGRTHQLRVHCAHPDGLGCPIVGDELYGLSPLTQHPTPSRLLLHACSITLTHPVTGQLLHLDCPPDF